MTDVFISYSRKDQDFVRKLYDALNEQERQAWVDWEGIPLTADWWAEIQRGIEAADTFLFIISPDSVISQTCNREVEHAVKHNKRIVPIVRREAMPEQMNSALARHNWLFAREDDDFDACFNSLIDALNTDLDYVRAHTRMLVRAREWEEKQKDTSYLLRGGELQEAESWLAQSGGKQPKPTELQTNYILASRRASSARQRTLLAGVTGALAITAILALVAVALFGVAENRRQESEARGTEVAQQAATATNALGLSESRGTEAAQQASTAIAAEATSARRAVEWRGLAWSVASERAQLAGDNDLALALALFTRTIPNPPPEIDAQMLRAAYAPGTALLYSGTHTDWVTNLALSADERWLLSASKDGILALHDAATGELLQSEQFGEPFEIAGRGVTVNYDAPDPVAFHPTQPEVAALGFNNGLLAVINVETWEVLNSLDTGRVPYALEFSPDGSQIAVAQSDSSQNLVLYDADTLEPVRVFDGHSDDVRSVQFAANGTQLLSGSNDATAKLWDVATGELIRTFGEITDPDEPDVDVIGAVFGAPNPNNRPTVILASNSGKIRTFDRDTGDQLLDYDTGVGSSTLADITISPDGRTLAASAYDSILSLWSTRDGRMVRSFRGHTGAVSSAIFSDDGRSLYSASNDATIRRWYTRSGGETLRLTGFENSGAAISLSMTGDESMAVVGGGLQDPAVMVWSLPDGALRYRLEGHTDAVQSLDTYTDASGTNFAVSGSWDGTIRIWNLDTGELDRTIEVGNNVVASIDVSQDTSRALVVIFSIFTAAGELQSIDLESGEVLQSYDPGFLLYLDAVYSPDESTILIGGNNIGANGRVSLLDSATGEVIRNFAQVHNSAVQFVHFNADGTRAISSAQDGLIVEWNVATGQETQRFVGHSDSASEIAYFPGERWIASASYDDTYRIWDRETGMLKLLLEADDDGRAVMFTADETLYTVSRDGSLTRWGITLDAGDAAAWARSHRHVRDFTCAERQINRIDPQCEG